MVDPDLAALATAELAREAAHLAVIESRARTHALAAQLFAAAAVIARAHQVSRAAVAQNAGLVPEKAEP
jgi:hypothetical protein